MNRFEAQENSPEDPKIAIALKEFLVSRLVDQDESHNFMPWEFDISDPHEADMERIGTNDFAISHLNIGPGVKGSRSFHFYVGDTEFHISGRAAEWIENRLRRAA